LDDDAEGETGVGNSLKMPLRLDLDCDNIFYEHDGIILPLPSFLLISIVLILLDPMADEMSSTSMEAHSITKDVDNIENILCPDYDHSKSDKMEFIGMRECIKNQITQNNEEYLNYMRLTRCRNDV
jgi:hypothetical protein